jgi:hypothetical protein
MIREGKNVYIVNDISYTLGFNPDERTGSLTEEGKVFVERLLRVYPNDEYGFRSNELIYDFGFRNVRKGRRDTKIPDGMREAQMQVEAYFSTYCLSDETAIRGAYEVLLFTTELVVLFLERLSNTRFFGERLLKTLS